QTLDARRMRQGQRDADRAAERVPHERGPGDADRIHEAAQRRGQVPEAVASARLRGASEAGQIDRVYGGPCRERRDVVAPRLGEAAEPVDQDDGGTSA